MIDRILRTLLLAGLAAGLLQAQTRSPFDGGWRFARFGLQADGSRRAEPERPEAPDFPDAAWRRLDLPHDWGIEGPFRAELAGETGKLPWKGIGWYRKRFRVPKGDAGKRVFVDFDGAMANAGVWLNGRCVGRWPYGYAGFRLELTRHLSFGAENVLAVRLDTENWDSRWYPGAGIYRHVWLVKTAPVHVAHWGTCVTTPFLTDAGGRVRARVTVDNQGGGAVAPLLRGEVFELKADGAAGPRVASTGAVRLEIRPASSSTGTLEALVARPRRWDLDSPNRYVLRTTVSVGGRVVDRCDTPFGFRTLEFTAREGFRLNGRRVPIQGTCNHHDLGALGAALHDAALARQLRILKGMGCNALRTSHNPPAPELLELADRLGLLVLDEAFDAWAQGKKKLDYSRLFAEWHERDLRALVRRDRNHPCVFMWSIGNEVLEQRDAALTKHLADLVRAEDPTRPVTNGYNDPDGGRESGAAAALDVMGVNYFFGQQDRWDADPRYAQKPTMGSETSSCVSSRGEYHFGTHRAGWQVSSYDLDSPEWGCSPDAQFRANARWPHLLGEFVWTGFDYLGEPTPYNSDETVLLNLRTDAAGQAELARRQAGLAKDRPPSRSSYFGIVDLAGFPKDRYYLYQAQWRPELPMAHILPHWTWPGRAGQLTPVHVYTSGDEAELFLNGVSQGRRARVPGKDFRLVWDQVAYQPGELKVIVTKGGKAWAEDAVRTAGEPARLELEAEAPALEADGRDLAFVKVRVVDARGNTVPRSHPKLVFSLEGPGAIVATDNGDATSFVPFQSTEREAFNGLALAILRAEPGARGRLLLRVQGEGLPEARLDVPLRRAQGRP